ncbi:TetR/AcrR family transcriptional regulator [Kitasatospora viridis]|uniref:TetR family transcriptional regulator n=1 Tax=Kitasatospora viridis TaxID=281105 RepID=A0A561UAE5_9ACTN|nr:TetR/AcrR family transcriptional regulator [Kitasatospora viridis]TWF96322.1 TetR family transcriptional regulator [Kitasatospora viridis]
MPSTPPKAPKPSGKPPAGAESADSPPELIWLRPERAGRGPRPAHSRASIAAAAVALADAEGLDAVTMRRIAAELGAGTMSLYTYVPKKEQLLDLMLDAITAELELPAAPSGDWRADLHALARGQLALVRRHGWAASAIRTRPSFGPNGLKFTEYFLGALAEVPLRPGAKMEALAMITGSICQFADWEQATAAAAQPGRWHQDLMVYLTQVAMSGDYPNLTTALAAGAGAPPPDPDASFDRYLDRLLTVLFETGTESETET